MSALLVCGCATDGPGTRSAPEDAENNEGAIPMKPIADVIRDRGDELLAMPGVTVVYEGALPNGGPCITVGVVDLRDQSTRAIPKSVDGYPVNLHETGAVGPR